MLRAIPSSAAALLLVLTLIALPAAAQEAPDYVVADPTFEALPGATGFSGTLTIDGADSGYQIEVPDDWNGTLVLYAHGFVGPQQADLIVQQPPLRPLFIDEGYAWAASSYSANGYVVDAPIEETHALAEQFADLTGLDAPTSTIFHGFSMGGHITAAAIERRPEAYVGALPGCGAIGDAALFDYFADANLVAGALAGVEVGVPETLAFLGGPAQTISATLGLQSGLNTLGTQYSEVLEALSGGERPTFSESLAFWNTLAAVDLGEGPTVPFLQALWGRALSMGIENPVGVAPTFDNTDTIYRFASSTGEEPSAVEAMLNAAVERFTGEGEVPFPIIDGTPQIPVLSLHNTGDLFVPLLNEVVYAEEVAANGLSDNLVQRTIRAPGHCDFTAEELGGAFVDLVTWIATGTPPAGEDLTDPAVVADRDLGCEWTSETRPGMPECVEPTATTLAGDDAVAAAIAVSGTREAASSVVLARVDVYADALAGATFAGLTGAPILLTGPGELDARVLAEVERLGATEVILLGGTAALSAGVEAALQDAGLTTSRLAGSDRFGTAAAVAAAVAAARSVDAVYLASGRSFADPVSVAGLAAFLGRPVLLTEPTFMPPETTAALEALGDPAVTVIGGSAVVSDEVAGDSPRLAGDNRYGTSDAVVAASRGAGLSVNRPWVATGEDFASALVAGPAAADAGQVLVLVDGDDLAGSTDSTNATLAEVGGQITSLVVVSGADEVSTESIGTLLGSL